MKRAMMILLVVAVAGLSYAAGVTTKPAYKFKWIAESQIKAMHKTVTMTELERRCIANRIECKPVKIRPGVMLVHLEAKVTPKGMQVLAKLEPEKEKWPSEAVTENGVRGIGRRVGTEARKRFCSGASECRVFMSGVLVYHTVNGGEKLNPVLRGQ